MGRSRHTEAQIIAALKQVEAARKSKLSKNRLVGKVIVANRRVRLCAATDAPGSM